MNCREEECFVRNQIETSNAEIDSICSVCISVVEDYNGDLDEGFSSNTGDVVGCSEGKRSVEHGVLILSVSDTIFNFFSEGNN